MISINKIKQKGMLFGLDARIALVIFAVFSLISVVLLKKYLHKIEITAEVVEINELVKAFEQYALDTGVYIPYRKLEEEELTLDNQEDIMSYLTGFSVENLIENKANINGWNGPYLQGYSIKDFLGRKVLSKKSGFYKGLTFANYRFQPCNGRDCYLWTIQVYPASEMDLLEGVAKKLVAGPLMPIMIPGLITGGGGMYMSESSLEASMKNSPMSSAIMGGTFFTIESIMSGDLNSIDTFSNSGYVAVFRHSILYPEMLGIFRSSPNYDDPYQPI